MKAIINTRQDIESLPTQERDEFLSRIAATIHRYDSDGKVITDDAAVRHYGFTADDFPDAPIAAYVQPPAPPAPSPRKQTKLVIMRRLAKLGKWETFKAILDQLPAIVHDSWDLAVEIDESDPLFLQHRPALLAALDITEEDLAGLFAAAQ